MTPAWRIDDALPRAVTSMSQYENSVTTGLRTEKHPQLKTPAGHGHNRAL